MTEGTRALSIIAYYLSEFDIAAVEALGYKTYKAAFEKISIIFGKENNYLKLRRDEFDALPDSSSYRKGWRNRKPSKDVVDIAAYLKKFSFNEMTNLVNAIIDAQLGKMISTQQIDDNQLEEKETREIEIENLINYDDSSAGVKIKTSKSTVRIYNRNIIRQLKKFYKGNCQLCGSIPFDNKKCNITEIHHIKYFAVSHNNNASNLIVLCPNHHRLLHKLEPEYDAEKKSFIYSDGSEEKIKINYHL